MTSQTRAAQSARIGPRTAPSTLRRSFWPPQWYRLLYQDYRRYRAAGQPGLVTVFLTQGFWASCVYRVSRAAV